MRLNIKIFKNVITMKAISIRKIYCVFAKIEFIIIIIKNSLIRDFEIQKNR